MTYEQRIEILQKALYPPTWPSDCELPLTPGGETSNTQNYNSVFKLIYELDSRDAFSFQNLFYGIQRLRKEGDLVKINAAAPVEQLPVRGSRGHQVGSYACRRTQA